MLQNRGFLKLRNEADGRRYLVIGLKCVFVPLAWISAKVRSHVHHATRSRSRSQEYVPASAAPKKIGPIVTLLPEVAFNKLNEMLAASRFGMISKFAEPLKREFGKGKLANIFIQCSITVHFTFHF